MEVMIFISVVAVAIIAVKIFANRDKFTPPPPGSGNVRDENDLR